MYQHNAKNRNIFQDYAYEVWTSRNNTFHKGVKPLLKEHKKHGDIIAFTLKVNAWSFC